MPVLVPGPAAVSSPPTRWRSRSNFSASLQWDETGSRPWIHVRTTWRFECGKLVMDLLKKDIRPRHNHHQTVDGKCHRGRRHDRRLDECGAPPVGRRPRSRRAIDDRRFRQAQPQSPAFSRSQTRRAFYGRRPVCGRRNHIGRETAHRCQAAASRSDYRDRTHDRARDQPEQKKPWVNKYCDRCPIPSSRPAGW